MADWNSNDEFDNDDDQHSGDGPADLRKAHRAAARRVKELEAELAARDEQIQKLTAKTRTVDLGELLQKNGANRKIARLVPKDVELTDEAVKAWLDENKDVLNITVTKDEQVTDEGDPADVVDDGNDSPSDGVDQDALAAISQFTALGGAGGTAIPTGALGALLSDVNANAKSVEDLTAIMRKHGLETIGGY